ERSVVLDSLFYETTEGRFGLPAPLLLQQRGQQLGHRWATEVTMPGRKITLELQREGDNFILALNANPNTGVLKWGVSISTGPHEHFTGLMERVVDGPQQNSWAPGRREGLDLRGQKVDMILKPTTSVYAPFYLSSRGYAVFAETDWPGHFDFCATDPSRV